MGFGSKKQKRLTKKNMKKFNRIYRELRRKDKNDDDNNDKFALGATSDDLCTKKSILSRKPSGDNTYDNNEQDKSLPKTTAEKNTKEQNEILTNTSNKDETEELKVAKTTEETINLKSPSHVDSKSKSPDLTKKKY